MSHKPPFSLPAVSFAIFVLASVTLFLSGSWLPALGYLIGILCTIHPAKRGLTIAFTAASLVAVALDMLVKKGPADGLPVHAALLATIALAGALVIMHQRSTSHLDQNYQELESLFNYATIGIVVTNRNGIITNFNPYAENQFGYDKADVLGKPVEVLIPRKFHGVHPEHRAQFHHHPEPRTMGEGRDLRARKKDGTEFPTEISLSDYRIGSETFVIAFVVDITVRKKAQEVVIRQNKELEQTSQRIKEMLRDLESKVANRTLMLKDALGELERSKEGLSEALEKEKELGDLKSRFVTIASHEFRTPLSTILSSAELLTRYNTAGDEQLKRQRHIRRITSSVAGMKNILEDFLSLQKMEEGFVKADMQVTTAAECVHEIQDTIQGMQVLTKRGQQILFEESLDAPLSIDLRLLRYILINLISNAVKFSPESGVIVVTIHVTDHELCLVVTDNGIGVSAEDQRHLFERFFRATNAVGIQGTGLGLHIVAKYVELMKGTISMESTEHIGTTFSICIPQHSPVAPAPQATATPSP
ncbi:MAG: histidine kinase [Flaviaesturariibacter sp.]|nr:histidine kinase [Flaviaesturariibacter sp.]